MGLKAKLIGIVLVVFAILTLLNTFGLFAFAGDTMKTVMVFLCGITALLGILFFTEVL